MADAGKHRHDDRADEHDVQEEYYVGTTIEQLPHKATRTTFCALKHIHIYIRAAVLSSPGQLFGQRIVVRAMFCFRVLFGGRGLVATYYLQQQQVWQGSICAQGGGKGNYL